MEFIKNPLQFRSSWEKKTSFHLQAFLVSFETSSLPLIAREGERGRAQRWTQPGKLKRFCETHELYPSSALQKVHKSRLGTTT